jgi:chromosome segregation ATPase
MDEGEMVKKKWKYLVALTAVLLVGLIVFLFVGNMKLKNQISELNIQVEKTDRKAEAIKKKYSEEKAKATALQRAKMAADSQMRTLETEIESLQKEMELTRGDQDAVIKEKERKLEKVKSALSDLSKEYDALNARYTELVEKLGTANNDIQDLEKDLAERRDKIRNLQSELKTANRKIDRIVGHNRELAEIGEELLAELDSHDAFDSLLEKEPFTQAKRVSLEKMIQEYLNRIDNEVLIGTDNY